MKISKADAANIVAVLVGLGLCFIENPVIRWFGGFVFVGAALIGLYRELKKARAEGKEVVF